MLLSEQKKDTPLSLSEGVRAKVYFKARKEEANDLTYLQVDDIKMDFSVKDIKMGIKSQQDNAIIGEWQ